jgi:hypothetical protein
MSGDGEERVLRLSDVQRVLDEYEDLAESWGDEAVTEGAIVEGGQWMLHATAARRIRRALFELAGATDPRAKEMDVREAAFRAALKEVGEDR